MKAASRLFLALFVTGALTLVVSAQQDPLAPPHPEPAPAPKAAFRVFSHGDEAWQFRHFQAQSQASQLAQQLVKATDEDEKSRLREKLTSTLNNIFDEHMKQQQKELDDLEKQIAHLRQIMKKRTDAKETIVERRIEQLIQDADGLGWNAPLAPGAPPGAFDFGPTYRLDTTTTAPKVTTTPEKKTKSSKEKDRKKSEDEDRKKSEDDDE
jgi:hypothetical protein